MKALLLIFAILGYQGSFSQSLDTSDVFVLDKSSNLILRPDIERNINRIINPIVKAKLQEFKHRNNSALQSMTDRQRLDEVQFAQDTIRIQEFLSEYEGAYQMATTTLGMNWGESKRLEAYDQLLNQYYQKSLKVLKPEMKSRLIKSQKRWLDYYTKEKEFIFELNDFGNHNSSLYNWGYYFEMLEKRVIFLKEIFQGNFNGSDTYTEE